MLKHLFGITNVLVKVLTKLHHNSKNMGNRGSSDFFFFFMCLMEQLELGGINKSNHLVVECKKYKCIIYITLILGDKKALGHSSKE